MEEVIFNWLEDAGRWKNCMEGCDEYHRNGCATCPDASLNSYELVMQAIDIMSDYINKKEDDGK